MAQKRLNIAYICYKLIHSWFYLKERICDLKSYIQNFRFCAGNISNISPVFKVYVTPISIDASI